MLEVSIFRAGEIHINNIDRAPNLIKKYRRTLKRLKLTPELAYREYDPRNIGFVIRTEFTDILRL